MAEKRGMKALELWCRRVTEGYPGVKIENMTTSWRDGLAFCALIHHFRPDLIDFDRLDKRDIFKNNELAFRIAERQLGIPALLDAEDMVEYEVPDRLSILTYLSQFYQAFVSNQQGPAKSPRTHSSKVSEIISPATKSPKTSKVGSGRLETCWSCRRPVFLAERLVAGGKLRHRTCFTCKRCGNQLNLVGCYETENGDFVCETCPDEEHREEADRQEVSKDECESLAIPESETDEFSLNFEIAIDPIVQKRNSELKMKFLENMFDDFSDVSGSALDSTRSKAMSMTEIDSANASVSEENVDESFPPESIDKKNQHSTASLETFKYKTLLSENFIEPLSRLGHEPESFIAEVSEIVENIVTDAVRKVENRVEKKLDSQLTTAEQAEVEIKSDETSSEPTGVSTQDVLHVSPPADKSVLQESTFETVKNNCKEESRLEDETLNVKSDDYPEDLNPFAEDDEEEKVEPEPAKPPVAPRKPPVPAARTKKQVNYNQSGRRIIEAPVVNLNPFWSDGEPSSDDDNNDRKPVPAPRSIAKATEEDSTFSRSRYGSFTSLNSLESSASSIRKKKGPAPQPPSNTKSPKNSQSPHSSLSLSPAHRSPSPSASVRSHRKSKPAPPPPMIFKSNENEFSIDKKEKNYENKVKQNLSVPDKSSYGKWKRKKGQAPPLPIPQRRRITPLPLPEFYRELEDLEIQQRELERQGVTIEQTIRMYETEPADKQDEGENVGKDVEGLILQLFDIVNQKNELFRRQAELMYLRRQQRLEEEHADLEYQIRCLMGRPERNKTDSDKAQEEELIRRLVEVVERRNEIIECLDMDRKREVEEDRSIHHHLEQYAGKKELESTDEEVTKSVTKSSSPSLLKLVKKKKAKKDKLKESFSKIRRDADKDIDEAGKEEEEVGKVKSKTKIKKKWFAKT